MGRMARPGARGDLARWLGDRLSRRQPARRAARGAAAEIAAAARMAPPARVRGDFPADADALHAGGLATLEAGHEGRARRAGPHARRVVRLGARLAHCARIGAASGLDYTAFAPHMEGIP